VDGAIEDYNQAIRFKPDYASAYNKRGVALNAKGDYDAAIRDYEKAIKYVYEGEEFLPFYNRGMARLNKGDGDGAIRDFSRAIRLKPKFPDAYLRRGMALAELKHDYRAALADYERFVQLGGDPAKADGWIRKLKRKIRG
jgi:tetratricopeptide (TPR) repeat protein